MTSLQTLANRSLHLANTVISSLRVSPKTTSYATRSYATAVTNQVNSATLLDSLATNLKGLIRIAPIGLIAGPAFSFLYVACNL